jgi:hypothetical protein
VREHKAMLVGENSLKDSFINIGSISSVKSLLVLKNHAKKKDEMSLCNCIKNLNMTCFIPTPMGQCSGIGLCASA